MLSMGLLSWISGDPQMIALLAQHWVLGTLLVAAIVYVETGFVIFPFLPGDSLLFSMGAFLGLAGVYPWAPLLVVCLAAVLGDATNYAIGRSRLGQEIVRRQWIKPGHLLKTQAYFERYGGPTIIIGRFVPIVRTLAPFLAGLSGMPPQRFLLFNITGGCIWCSLLVLGGYWLGNNPVVRGHMHVLFAGIVVISLLPVLIRALRQSWRRRRADALTGADAARKN